MTREISIHAPRVGSDDYNKGMMFPPKSISIHAPRVGSDKEYAEEDVIALMISIHAPRVGSDASISGSSGTFYIFQSTLPVWGATNSGSVP